MTRRVEYVPLDDVLSAAENAKNHDRGGILASTDRWGIIDLPVVDDRTGRLVAGHGRIETYREARNRDRPPPADIRIGEDGSWQVPVLRGWASMDDDEALAAGIALNALVPAGGWQSDRLADLLTALSGTPGGLTAVGFTQGDIKDLLKDLDREPIKFGEGPEAGNARTELSIGQLAENYRNKQVRTMVLDFPAAEYRDLKPLADASRAKHKMEGNAELFAFLLGQYDEKHPATDA